jgi:hypothetical protein
MKLTIAMLFLLVGLAYATATFAVCPYDGTQSMWTGMAQGVSPNRSCEYKHEWYDPKTYQNKRHVFWQACD